MSVTVRASAHARQRAATRRTILDAAMAILRDEPTAPFSHEAVAARTGIAARTVYRHFRARGDLVGALWERLRDETGTQWPTAEPDLAQAARAQFGQFEAHAALVRASIAAAATTGYPVHGSAEGRAAFRQSLSGVLATLPPGEADRVVAVCVAIYSAPFWQMLRDRGQLGDTDAAEAAAWALDAVVAAAHARAAVHARAAAHAERATTPPEEPR